MKHATLYFATLAGLGLTAALTAAEPEKKAAAPSGAVEIVNVSDNHARELWKELNERFTAHAAKEGKTVRIVPSEGGWSTQLQSVLDKKVEPDVVTLGVGTDVDALRRAGLIAENWQYRLPHRSVVYGSIIVFLVPKGNPRTLKTWDDLTRPDVQVLSTNPKTSRTGRHGFLAAWGSVLQRGGTDAQARDLVAKLYRKATLPKPRKDGTPAKPFVPRQDGEVLLAWEKEAIDAVKASDGKLEIVYPPVSIRGENAVAVVDRNVERKGTRAAAETYLRFLFSEEAQEIVARHDLRPVRPVARREGQTRPRVELFTIHDLFADPAEGQQRFFGKDGLFEQIRTAEK